MAKTQAQTRDLGIKKEEEEEDCKPTLLLNRVDNTRNNNKITKRKPSKNRSRNLVVPEIKVEEDTDIKSLLQSTPKSLKLPKKQQDISQEQINQLIDYIVNHGFNVSKASNMAKMSYSAGFIYYNQYKNDSEKKIPAPRNRLTHPPISLTQEQIDNLIKDINNDKMTIKEASAKANICYASGRKYYKKYLKDQNHTIPIPRLNQKYTQDQKNEFIGYIVNDKMSIKAASLKAKMGVDTGRRYYHKYFDNQNPGIPTPGHINYFPHYTQEQIKEVISYIVDDKMSISAASRKANMSVTTVTTRYRQYIKDNNMELPVRRSYKRYTQGEINKAVGYIVDDKMCVYTASKKANMSHYTVNKYYQQYLKKHNLDPPISRRITQDKINKLVGYIVDDKMSIKAASKKVKVSRFVGSEYYRRYLKDHNIEIPTRRYTQDQKNELLGYIVHDKMTIKAASKKVNMHYYTGRKYYQQYLKDQKL